MYLPRCSILLAVVCCCLYACSPDLPEDVAAAYQALPEKLDYNKDVKPVLSDKCFACHGPDKGKQKAGLRLDLPASAFGELPENPGKVAIDPGNLQGSELFHRILSNDPEYKMPSPESHLQLSAKEKAVLIKWIKKGAAYKPHWAFVKPEKHDVPSVGKDAVAHNEIDNFIIKRVEQEGMKASPEADKELLLRRLSLDLTGLPPSLQEIDAFLKDQSPNAYEKQVNRLLSSPHYGEKMAVDWLDVARYADSHGYTVDRLRDMSPYRDWVINAFNSNFPYDKFIQWQLAGDLMPHPTKEMLIATAFNRNHPQNMEGGIIEDEFKAEYVVDRTNTFGEAFLAISVGCAKCHDHKFDPVSQKSYYELFSFFNNVKEAGQISWDDALPTPTLMLPDKEKEALLQYMQRCVGQQEQKLAAEKKQADATDFGKWLQSGAYKKLAHEPIPSAGLQAYYTLDNAMFNNSVHSQGKGSMRRETGQPGDAPVFTDGHNGKALVLNGDTWLDLGRTGIFRRSDPFSVGIWVNIPKELKEGVIFHKSQAERLYNFRGYHLYLKDDRLEINMAHTAPSNAITRMSKGPVPKDRWIQLTLTYDGSSKAAGLQLYMDGQPVPMETTMDQLTKDILFINGPQPGLQIGGWWRGLGFKNGKADDVLVYNRVLTPYEIKIIAGKAKWQEITDQSVDHLSDAGLQALEDYYVAAVDPATLKAQATLQQLRTTLADSTENVPELMVMQEMPKPRKTHILLRGNYDALGEEVFPNTPEAILPFSKKLPKNRYGLAQWLTDKDNPLTARVVVNRIWQNFFGIGLVKTSGDFGNQGEMPSHLELLDWLAIHFRESGWNIKQLNKMIVMSATYRQGSRASAIAREKDPENRLLSHGPAYRMTAEMIRDNALMASGLMDLQIGGKSVKPYQPEGLWEINNTTYTRDTGKAVYRRSLYVVIKRSVPNPTLATFDAGSRSYCVVRRQQTNTPLQALVTLNDPTFIEASSVLGEQITRAGNGSQGIIDAYRKLTGRTPAAQEVTLLMKLRDAEQTKFRAHPAKTKGWLHTGQYIADKKLDAALVAANAVVANTILNSDAALTKR